MCINFNYYLLFILHAFTCTVAYFIFIFKKKKKKNIYIYIIIYITRAHVMGNEQIIALCPPRAWFIQQNVGTQSEDVRLATGTLPSRTLTCTVVSSCNLY